MRDSASIGTLLDFSVVDAPRGVGPQFGTSLQGLVQTGGGNSEKTSEASEMQGSLAWRSLPRVV